MLTNITADSVTVGDKLSISDTIFDVDSVTVDLEQINEEVAIACSSGHLIVLGRNAMVPIVS